MNRLAFLYPWWLLLIPFVVWGWFYRKRKKYYLFFPTPWLLLRLEKERVETPYRFKQWFVANWPSFLAILSLVSAVLVLAVPIEREAEYQWTTKRREGIFVSDVSESMLSGTNILINAETPFKVLKRAQGRFIEFWLKKNPQDRLGIITFSEGGTPLIHLTSDAESLIFQLEHLESLTTDFGNSTHLERGLFAAILMFLSQSNPLEIEKLTAVLEQNPSNIEVIKNHFGPEMKKWRSAGKFIIIFTDSIVELYPQKGMASPLLLVEFLGELGITPYFITTEVSSEEQNTRNEISRLVKRYGGKDFYCYASELASKKMDVILDEIILHIKPAPMVKIEYLSSREVTEKIALISLSLAIIWIIARLLKINLPF